MAKALRYFLFLHYDLLKIGLFAPLFEQLVLDVPQLLREIDIVVVRVLKALNLIPQRVDFLRAVVADLGGRGRLIDTLAAEKDRHLQFAHRVVGHGLALPGVVGAEPSTTSSCTAM